MESNIKALFEKYIAGNATEQELHALYDHFELEEGSNDLTTLINDYLSGNKEESESTDEASDRIVHTAWQNLQQGIKRNSTVNKKRPFKWLAAAAALLVFGITIPYFIQNKKPTETALTSIYGNDVMPGTNKATLTLSNGDRYELKDSKEGLQIQESGISYLNGESIASTNEVDKASINVPNGGTYKITLPDGTKVQLNSGTEFTYPIRFGNKERQVQLRGEGYFEVSHDASKPFKVQSGNQIVTVLGTHFNVQAYGDEAIETTLLEGRVSVSSSTHTKATEILNPGQQSSYENGKLTVKKVSADDYIGWTKNLFVFNDLTLAQIFRHLERWYDVDIDYPASLSNEQFMMEIPKGKKLSEVLESISALENITFKIQGRRITVKQR